MISAWQNEINPEVTKFLDRLSEMCYEVSFVTNPPILQRIGHLPVRVFSACLLAFNSQLAFSFSVQLEEACEMSVKIGQGSVRKNLKTFALQNFGMLFGIAIMFILALYGGDISVA